MERITSLKKNGSSELVKNLGIFSLIATSGIPFFTSTEMVMLFFALSVYFHNPFNKAISSKALFPFLVMTCIMYVGQLTTVGFSPFLTYLGWFLKLFFAFNIVCMVKDKFWEKYVNVLTPFVAISLIFYFSTLINNSFANFFITKVSPFLGSPFADSSSAYQQNLHIIVFNFSQIDVGRNSGPFWEPTAYAIYLIFGLIAIFYIKKTIYNIQGLIFVTALITTLSTTGYVVFFILILAYFIIIKRNLISVLMMVVFIFIGLYVYETIPFLKEKIDYQISLSNKNKDLDKRRRTRFVSFALDIEEWLDYPFFGKGRNEITRFGTSKLKSIETHRNNGISDFLLKFGIIYFLLYFFYYYKSWLFVSNFYFKHTIPIGLIAIIILSLTFILAFSEILFLKPFFIAIPLLGNYYKSSYQLQQ